jgi:hypothetical protein
MGIPHEEKSEFHSRDRWLIFSLLVGPMAALTDLTVSYALVPDACAQGTKWMLHLSTVIFALVALTGAAIAFRVRRLCESGGGYLWIERTKWVATVAMVLAVSSVVVILAMEIPNLILRSCD